MNRREFTKRQRAEIVMRATGTDGVVVCEGCGLRLGGKAFEIDHVIAEGLIVDKSAPLTIGDGQLLGRDCCHRGGANKTAEDVRMIAKAKRQYLKNIGAWPKSKRPLRGRGFQKRDAI